MSILDVRPGRTLSVTAASTRGVAGLLKDAEHGGDIIVERHGRAVAAIVPMNHLEELKSLRADLTAAALVLAREATDNGNRTELDTVIESFGFSRAELEAEVEVEADIAAGRE